MLCVAFIGLLCSSSLTIIPSTTTATQYTRPSTNQTFSESCNTTTVHRTANVTIKPLTAINPSQISCSKQSE